MGCVQVQAIWSVWWGTVYANPTVIASVISIKKKIQTTAGSKVKEGIGAIRNLALPKRGLACAVGFWVMISKLLKCHAWEDCLCLLGMLGHMHSLTIWFSLGIGNTRKITNLIGMGTLGYSEDWDEPHGRLSDLPITAMWWSSDKSFEHTGSGVPISLVGNVSHVLPHINARESRLHKRRQWKLCIWYHPGLCPVWFFYWLIF